MQLITIFNAIYYNFFTRNRLESVFIGTDLYCSGVDHMDMDTIMSKNPLDFQGVIYDLLVYYN